ncbi:MAG: hypothetical protein GEV11_14780 [Streptosporangiales bacterium]|nr:hypothetical protein [Streptosporangiales bacterium]
MDSSLVNLDDTTVIVTGAVMRVHLKGHFTTVRAATEHWRERSKADGAPVAASVINTASEAFLLGSGGQPNYAAAKGGMPRSPPRSPSPAPGTASAPTRSARRPVRR